MSIVYIVKIIALANDQERFATSGRLLFDKNIKLALLNHTF